MVKLNPMRNGAPTGRFSSTPLSEIVPLLVDRSLADVAREIDVKPGTLWHRLRKHGYTVRSIREAARRRSDGKTVRQRIREREATCAQ